MKLVDVPDSKSGVGNNVPVRLRPWAFLFAKNICESNLTGSYLSQNQLCPQTFPFSVVIKTTTARGRNENIKIANGSKFFF